MDYSLGYTTPRKYPRESDSADSIAQAQLGRTPEGRAATYDSRVALQRELDGTRSALKSQDRFADDQRRLTAMAREEAAVFKAENLRLQDELRSCKARLNSALDTQEELLRKNSDKHQQVLEIQQRESKLREELASRASMVEYYTGHNQQLEHQLSDILDRAHATETSLTDVLRATEDKLAHVQGDLAQRNAENDSLAAMIEALRAELETKGALLDEQASALKAADRDRADVQAELRASVRRVNEVSDTQVDLRAQLAASARTLEAKESELRGARSATAELGQQLADKEVALNRTIVDKAELERTVTKTDRVLEAQMAAARAKERLLQNDLTQLSRYAIRRDAELEASASARAMSSYYKLKLEREEAERLEALARLHRRRSLGLE